MPDKPEWMLNAPASKGAGDPGVGQGETESSRAEPPAPSEAGVKALEEDGNPRDVGSAGQEREVDVGDSAVTGTGLLTPEPVQTTSRSASRAGRTLGRLGAKKGYALGAGLQLAAKKKKERETIRVPVKKTDCPRWMHHRPGEYCKTCGKTP